MNELNTYLTFDGTCRDAMTFYQQCLGGKLEVLGFAESGNPVPPGAENRTIHARLDVGDKTLMASDSMPGMTVHFGNNFSIAVGCDSREEIERLYGAMSAGGNVTMPLQETFFADRFGMLVDRFGIQWMFSLEKEHRA